ncbi:outer membrane protein assembly factor BamD [Pontibacter harenae]|uniref:outer membrane protein assembly factor BamD n=1 Tax=Pontibacter harenae TaxID=2894083 RepID=UPI001E2DB62E|nr:outer membrane protein assembly factor BamD [Pontibacter harenae]MCC9168896.1 outer membrane protein assembly factor BamD [Pontibacter harenae]
MNRGFFHTILLLGFLLLASSCSNFQKLLKSNNVEEKYQAALNYYEKEDYYRANELFKQVVPLLSGTAEAEKANFYYASSFYHLEEYISSSYQFNLFVQTYPRSEYAEEALFLQAKSLYNQSPGFEQDQSQSITALEALQEFIQRNPTTAYAEEVNKMIEDLNRKLDRKAFENAKVYYNMRYYRSAVVAFNNFQRENASSPFSEEAAFLKLESQYLFAQESVFSKQEERFLEAVDFYQSFVDLYPESSFKRRAEQIYDNTVIELEKIKVRNQTSNQANL